MGTLTWPAGVTSGKNKPGDPVMVKNIYYNGKWIMPDEQSSVLVIGNSHLIYPMKRRSYISHFAYKNHIIPDELCIRGLGILSSIPYELFNNPSRYLKGKKVCIFPIPAMQLTTSRHFANLHEIDSGFVALSGKKECYGDAESRFA